jgi:hypothetical protein
MKKPNEDYMNRLKEQVKKRSRKICCAKCLHIDEDEHYNPHDIHNCKLLQHELDSNIPDKYDYVCDSFDNGIINKEVINFRKIDPND